METSLPRRSAQWSRSSWRTKLRSRPPQPPHPRQPPKLQSGRKAQSQSTLDTLPNPARGWIGQCSLGVAGLAAASGAWRRSSRLDATPARPRAALSHADRHAVGRGVGLAEHFAVDLAEGAAALAVGLWATMTSPAGRREKPKKPHRMMRVQGGFTMPTLGLSSGAKFAALCWRV